MEIGNQVFMQYRRSSDGSFEILDRKNVDFGGGLERITAAANDDTDVFKGSLLWPIIERLEVLSDKKYESYTGSMRVIADHLRAAVFLAVDDVTPSNKEQGYVMRRLLRRAIRFALDLGIENNFLSDIVPIVADLYQDDYPEVMEKKQYVVGVLVKEETIFRQTLQKGLKQLSKLTDRELTGADLFTLYDTYGFPVELSTEEVFKQNIKISKNWRTEFDDKMKEQKMRSQSASKGLFKGGLSTHSQQNVKYHTATHLLGAALRLILGKDVMQKGSNITDERLRYDFNYPSKLTDSQIGMVEKQVNDWIEQDLPVKMMECSVEEAHKIGAIGVFDDKYGERVKVYQIGHDDAIVDLEICGGPHVEHTAQLNEDGNKFKIIKEESSSSGIRRIKAVLA
jgi:alanyl-tRNA synthetase